MESNKTENKLEILYSEKGDILVTIIVGKMDKSTVKIFEEYAEQILQKNNKNIVFVLNDVPDVDMELYRPLTLLQKSLRERGGKIRFTRIRPNLAKELVNASVLRENEIINNLKDALADVGINNISKTK